MFTIDLLKGAGKPPKSHPLWVAGVTLAFLALLVGGVLDAIGYYRDESLLATQKRTLAYYEQEIRQMKDVADMLAAAEKRRIEVDGTLAEVSKALAHHAVWSPVIETVARSTPEDLVITNILAKREEQGVGDKARFTYTLMLGVVSPTGPLVVEQFVRTLRLILPLQGGPDSVRIGSQGQEMLGGRQFQMYMLECRLKIRE
jgi:hypothetical protein